MLPFSCRYRVISCLFVKGGIPGQAGDDEMAGQAGDDELQFVLHVADDLTVEEVHDPLCA